MPFRLAGHGLCAVLLLIVGGVFGVAAYQLDNWKPYFFRGTLDLGNACSVAAMTSDGRDRPAALATLPLTPMAVPHLDKPLTMSGESVTKGYYHAHYLCSRPTQDLPVAEGIPYLHLGWVFADDTEVFVNGSLRAAFKGLDHPIIPLTSTDLRADALTVEVWASGTPTDRFGLTGVEPMVIASKKLVNQRIFGIEGALNAVRDLYTLLPTLTLGLVIIFGWMTGLRSPLVLTTLFYFALSALRSINAMFADSWPWEMETSWHLFIPLTMGTNLGFILFGAELLGVRRPWLRWGPALTIGAMVLQGAILLGLRDPWPIEQHVVDANNLASVIATAVIALGGWRARGKLPQLERRRVTDAFLILCGLFSLVLIVDSLFANLGVPLRLGRYIELIMPLFIGGLLLYTLGLIEKSYRLELAARQRIESDLTLARAIQDSLAPPPTQMHAARLNVLCYQIKHDKVAGDWMAIRDLPDGGLVAVVADATGKGMQAALVTHAVQSLWADSMDDAVFDAKIWLTRVNRTLIRLGERQPHSMTLGVVLIEGARVTYWSAGHVPLFLVLTADGKQTVKPMMAKGRVLGLSEELKLESSTFELPVDAPVQVLLGTDGVFANGSRSSKREILEFTARLASKGREALEECIAEDDKTLVLIERAAA